MAKQSSRRRNGGVKISVAVVAGMLPAITTTYNAYNSYGKSWYMAFANLAKVMSGFDITKNNTFAFGNLWYGAIPIVAGAVVHQLANRLGINRSLSGVPFIRI